MGKLTSQAIFLTLLWDISFLIKTFLVIERYFKSLRYV